MPSIPQSLLWISLVVLWLFVLVPMLISKRDAVRRTSDVLLATRVLNSGTAARLLRRNGPAAGHRSDPDWQPSEDDVDDEMPDDYHDAHDEAAPRRSVVVAAADTESGDEPDYLDVDIVEEDSGALPIGGSAQAEPEVGTEPEVETEPEVVAAGVSENRSPQEDFDAADDDADTVVIGEPLCGGIADEYEYVEDSSGLEAEGDADEPLAEATGSARRRRYESKTAAAVSARKYKFRKRVLSVMALVLVGSAAAALTVAPWAWWVCGSAAAITVLYLAYLRRQTRIEDQVRRRRVQRMMRSRLGVENTEDSELDVVPSRLRQPGAAVLDIDDEDPIFEHLDDASEYDLPRAAGQ